MIITITYNSERNTIIKRKSIHYKKCSLFMPPKKVHDKVSECANINT